MTERTNFSNIKKETDYGRREGKERNGKSMPLVDRKLFQKNYGSVTVFIFDEKEYSCSKEECVGVFLDFTLSLSSQLTSL